MRRGLILSGLFLSAVPLLLAGCGARKQLTPPAGQPMPVAPRGAATTPTSEQLLKPGVQTRPARSDELLEASEQRRSDEFDLPPD